MIVLPGSSALTVTKREAILLHVRKECPEIQSVDAVYIHLVKSLSGDAEDLLRDSNSNQHKILNELLCYGDDVAFSTTRVLLAQNPELLVYALPRPGSISPWSSKATDISRLCNLGQYVERIERGICYVFTISGSQIATLSEAQLATCAKFIHDRMTQSVTVGLVAEDTLFQHHDPKALKTIDLQDSPERALETLARTNAELGLALAQDEIQYLAEAYATGDHPIKRNPTDAELFMFAQVNSEHCRHKIFNASWIIDGISRDKSLFQMIRNTEAINGQYTVSAYSDNAAVFVGYSAPRFTASLDKPLSVYQSQNEVMSILVKVETHNHPTAVSPYPGAATGSGGEIRDEGAVGRGSKPKAGLSGFTVSNLLIPGFEQPWEEDFGRPQHIASALDIMTEAPLGASAFNNEFGRPALAGYFRTFSERIPSANTGETEIRGFHKPIMIAGGVGNVRPRFVKKPRIDPGAKIAVVGGPGMLIGLGGGAASSQASGAGSAELDFASVQRDNAEMQRRCQQVIDACVELGDNNPIQSIHDVGAGGLSNALPELVHDSELGATFEIRDVLVADTSMSPMEIWCNESQERYVMAIAPDQSLRFQKLCERERCPFSFVGTATANQSLIVTDRLLKQEVINLSMHTLFGKPPRMTRKDETPTIVSHPFDCSLEKYLPSTATLEGRISIAVDRVLHLPSVGSKAFLITIGDRSITGLVTRDQMVGPWQVPVADVAVTRTSYGFDVVTGEAMAMGERPIVALLNAGASARLAVAESIMNLAAASIESIERVKLSANWMCAASKPGEGARLYEAVQAIGMDLCPALGIGIPVGKDSMSMSMRWKNGENNVEVSSPLSLNITAFAPVHDIRQTWTPHLRTDVSEDTALVFFDLSNGHERVGGSAIAQVFREIGSSTPEVDSPATLKAFFNGCQRIRTERPDLVLAYHDRSDGGLFTTIVEMCFAGRVGAEISLDAIHSSKDPVATLFNEELGAVMQVRTSDLVHLSSFTKTGFPMTSVHVIGSVNRSDDQTIKFMRNGSILFSSTRPQLQQAWAETSYRMQSIRDDPVGAKQEFGAILDDQNTGLFFDLTFSYEPIRVSSSRPKVAILREQGVNGHVEMAWAFTAAGFDAIDVHMSDIISGSITLTDFRGIAACGGFSYGDVLGAGNGWASSVLLNERAREEFKIFFRREDVFGLAVCNGCQFFSHLRRIIPGTEYWPEFKANRSERFEARVAMVEIPRNAATASSVFLRDMAGSKLPVAVAHGEGRASFSNEAAMTSLISQGLVAVRYVDSQGRPTEEYPLNPNGSPGGITGVQTPDGRMLALMPHPERVTTLHSNSWFPPSMTGWEGTGPWFRMFQSARRWCG